MSHIGNDAIDSTDYTDMHRAGYHPSFQEADSILERVRDLDAAEPRMMDELRRLEARIVHVRRQAALGRALLSPWRRIPPEIWSEIFILSVPEYWSRTPINQKLLACAEVCYSWRVIALSTSQLWTDITIDLNTGTPMPNLEASFITHMGRAGNQLLRVRGRDVGIQGGEPYFNSMLWQLISQQSRRWKTIELFDVHPRLYAKFKGLPYRNLRSLILLMGDEDTAMTQVHAFDDAPELCSLKILGTCRLPVDFELSPSWRLHTLGIAYAPFTHGHALDKPFLDSILPCSQTLQRLVLDAEISGDRVPVHPTTLPSLEELELTDGAVYIMERILRPTTLHTLVLRQDILERENTANTLDVVYRFLDQSTAVQHTLRTLKLQSIQTTGIIRVLQRLPRLTRLEVEDSYWTDHMEPGDAFELAEALQRDRTRPDSLALLPDLTHLTLRFDRMLNTRLPRIIRHAEQSRLPTNPCTLNGRQLAYLEQLRAWWASIPLSSSLF